MRYLTAHVAERIGKCVKGAQAQHAYLITQNGATRSALASNPNLSETLWHDLHRKCSVDVAAELYGRELNTAQMQKALADQRLRPRVALLRHAMGQAPAELVEAFLVPGMITDDQACAWLYAENGGSLLPQQRRELALRVGSRLLFREMAKPDVFPDIDEVVALTRKHVRVPTNIAMFELFQARPELVGRFEEIDDLEARVAAASSQHLLDAELQMKLVSTTLSYRVLVALLRNPATTAAVADRALTRPLKPDLRNVVARAHQRWGQAPGAPLTTTWADLTDSAQQRRVEFFAQEMSYNFGAIGLPWRQPQQRPSYDRARHDLSDVNLSNLSHGLLWMTDWGHLSEQIESRLGDDLEHFTTFFTLVEEWKGTLDDLVNACLTLAPTGR